MPHRDGFEEKNIHVIHTVPTGTDECGFCDAWGPWGDRDLTCTVLFGCMCPCYARACCTEHIPEYTQLQIISKSGEWEEDDNSVGYFVPDARITVRALKEDADGVVALLKEGLAGKFSAAPCAPIGGLTAPGVNSAVTGEATLPPGWAEVKDPASGQMYFYNEATQETPTCIQRPRLSA